MRIFRNFISSILSICRGCFGVGPRRVKQMRGLAVVCLVGLFLISGCGGYDYKETNFAKMKEKYGKLVQAYNYSDWLTQEKYMFVFINEDSVIYEIRVSPGVYYTYYDCLKHKGFIMWDG